MQIGQIGIAKETAKITNFETGSITTAAAMMLFQQLAEEPQTEPLPYCDDPLVIQADYFEIEYDDGQRELVNRNTNHKIVRVGWQDFRSTIWMIDANEIERN